jgi:hypothetical protein
MPDPVAFEFETAKQLMRLLKKSKDGTFNSEIDDEIPLDHSPALIWAYVPATVTCTYDATVKAWVIPGAVLCYPINSGVDANGLMQWGKNNSDGIVTGGITCTTFTPKLASDQAAPSIGKGFYLGTIFDYNGSEQPRVLIGLPPVSSASSGGSATIEVVTDVICTPTGIEVSTVTLSGADYDNAVIRQFLALSDVTPSSYLGNQGRVVKVNDAATALEFGPIVDSNYTTFIALSDSPAEYGTSNTYKTLTVSAGNNSVVFSANNITTTKSLAGGGNPNDPAYVALSLVNDETSPGNNRVYGTTSAGVKGYRTLQLTALTDFPSTTGHGGKFVKVNSGGTGLQYTGPLAAVADVTAHTISSVDLATAVSSAQTAIDDLTSQVNLLLARIRSQGLIS